MLCLLISSRSHESHLYIRNYLPIQNSHCNGNNGASAMLYAGQPQNIPVVAKGSFIRGFHEQLAGYRSACSRGKFSSCRKHAAGPLL